MFYVGDFATDNRDQFQLVGKSTLGLDLDQLGKYQRFFWPYYGGMGANIVRHIGAESRQWC